MPIPRKQIRMTMRRMGTSPGTDSQRRFFIALLPPKAVQTVAWQLKQEMAEVYQSYAALRSPPHITLQPPFLWPWEQLSQLHQGLAEFALASPPIPITLENFDVFKPKVIFIQVHPQSELLNLQQALAQTLHQQFDLPLEKRPFHPHLTIGFRDLDRANFHKAWASFQTRSLYFAFTVPQLTLLIHDGQHWQIQQEFPFLGELSC